MKKLLLSILSLVAVTGLGKAEETADNVQVLIDTDFTVFTEGSEESPKSLYSSSFNAKVNGYYMVSSVSAAGGKVLVGASGYLTLKQFESLPTSGATIRITAEVKMLDEYGGALKFTRGYSSTDVVYAQVDGTDWTTVTVYASGYTGTSASRLKVEPFLSISGFYIKSLKVEYSPDFIAAPEAYLPTDADGTQFTASCSRVAGASKYEADVFSLDKDNNPVYFVQDVELTALSAYSNPSAKITGLNPGTTYYYVARAINADGKKSENSEVVEVVKSITSIDAPEALAATNVTETGFTANWDAVADAKYYIVYTYEKEKLTEASEVAVFDEDFSGVTVGTVASIELTGNIDDFTKMPGWIADYSSKAFAAGYYVFYPYKDPGTLTTPSIDLSANDGKFSVTVKGFTGAYGTMKATQNTIGAELLVNGDVVETATTLTCDKSGLYDFVFNFTKGTSDCRIRFVYTLADEDSNKFYADEISISQLMPAGTEISKLLGNLSSEATSADISLTPVTGKAYCYGVVAVGQTVVGSGTGASVGEIMSAVSNLVEVNFNGAGVDNVISDTAINAWKAGEGTLGVNGSDIAVHDLMGRTLYHRILPADTYTLNLGLRGLIIVTVDGTSHKIVL